MEKKLYKILVNGASCHGGDLKWSLPKNGNPGAWHEVKGDLKICEKGIHLTTERFKWYKWGCSVYEAEAEDIISWEEDKCVARKVRLLKEVKHPKWWTDCEGWIATLKDIAWLKPDGKPKKEWKLFETRGAAKNAAMDAARDVSRDTAGNAAWAAVWTAAWDAAGDAAWVAAWDAAGDAAGNAARDTARDAAWVAAWDAAGAAAGDAAGAAAWDTARAAAWDTAGAAAGDAAGDAAWDTALYTRGIFICDGLPLAEKHKTHIKKRMEVWQKGYGLWGDINGVFYVYKKV